MARRLPASTYPYVSDYCSAMSRTATLTLVSLQPHRHLTQPDAGGMASQYENDCRALGVKPTTLGRHHDRNTGAEHFYRRRCFQPVSDARPLCWRPAVARRCCTCGEHLSLCGWLPLDVHLLQACLYSPAALPGVGARGHGRRSDVGPVLSLIQRRDAEVSVSAMDQRLIGLPVLS